MAQSNFTIMTTSLDAAVVDRGVTAGTTVPNGGGTFVYGFNSLQVPGSGGVALFANQLNYAPMASGGSIRGAIRRATSGGTTGWAPFLFIGAQGPDINDAGYLLGLSDDDPSHIVLKKGTLSLGIPSGTPDPTNNGILRRSTDAIDIDTWYQLRLDMVVNGSGDVILKCFMSDLDLYAVTGPTWTTINGMADFTDDSLGVNTGSAPYTSGRAGYGMQVSDVTRRAYFDQIEVFRQL